MEGTITNSPLSDEGRLSILRVFGAARAEWEAARIEGGDPWRWTGSVVLFPEGECPWCKSAIRSLNTIWVVDNVYGSFQLKALFKLNGSQLVRSGIGHPHVSGINICQGNSRTPAQALFFSMYPDGSYWGFDLHKWNNWLIKVWDHSCVSLGRKMIEFGRSNQHYQECARCNATRELAVRPTPTTAGR